MKFLLEGPGRLESWVAFAEAGCQEPLDVLRQEAPLVGQVLEALHVVLEYLRVCL